MGNEEVLRIELTEAYDEGYRAVERFWPTRPGSVLHALHERRLLKGGVALDAGCGEGTNAHWLANRGYTVDGVEVSPIALGKAAKNYTHRNINWYRADIQDFYLQPQAYDLVVAYGLLHCIPEAAWGDTVSRLQSATTVGGILVLVAFNARSQDIQDAHPGFHPTLKTHSQYMIEFESWEVVLASDEDLHETHPHNGVPHTHSMTRLAARRTV